MASPASSAPEVQDSRPVVMTSVTKRYNDAYALARFQTGLGKTIKVLALIIGGFIAFVFLLYMLSQSVPQQGMFGMTTNVFGIAGGFLGMMVGVLMGGIGWVYGSSISAQGQMLKATLDT